MKKRILITSVAFAFVLSTGLSWASDSIKIDTVSEDVLPDQTDQKKKLATWSLFHEGVSVMLKHAEKQSKNSTSHVEELKSQLRDVEEESDKLKQKFQLYQRVGNACSLYEQLDNICGGIQKELEKWSISQNDSSHATSLYKSASALYTLLVMSSISTPAPFGKGNYDVSPFGSKASFLTVGESHLFIPGSRIASVKKQTIDIIHTRENEVSYWTLSNGFKVGINSVDDTVTIDGSSTNVISFKDSSTLILFPSNKRGIFNNLEKEGEEKAQVDCSKAAQGIAVSYALSDVKTEELTVNVPGTILSGVKVICDNVRKLDAVGQLAPVYKLVCDGVAQVRKDIMSALEKAQTIVKTYEKM